MALLEVLLLGEELGYSVVLTSLVLASAEAAIEFASSALVPRLYLHIHRTDALSVRWGVPVFLF